MKRLLGLFLFSLVITLASCGGGNGAANQPGAAQSGHSFVGTFTDEFGNRFTLNEDYSATIQFMGIDSLIKSSWFDGIDHTQPFISIEFNGDPAHWYLRDGQLYMTREDMISGSTPIKITYDK